MTLMPRTRLFAVFSTAFLCLGPAFAAPADPARKPVALSTAAARGGGAQTPGAALANAASRALESNRFEEAAKLAAEALKADPGNKEAATVLHFAAGRSALGKVSKQVQAKVDDQSPQQAPSRESDTRPVHLDVKTKQAARPPDSPYKPALDTLSKSEAGKEIVEFLKTQQIPILVREDLPPNTAAAYYPETRVIVVPPSFFKDPPIIQAIGLGHEGFHAVQNIQYHSAVTLETEVDAWERQCVMYRELMAAGVPGVAATDFDARAYQLFETSVRAGHLERFEAWVAGAYKQHAAANKRAMAGSLPAPLRGIANALLNSASFPGFRNAEFAREQRGLRSTLTGRNDSLENSLKHHQENKSWVIEKSQASSR